ncbi:hypothetical protein FVE85_9545 [Porphyridium purpureum]|uniref:Uncharacterized protein n=1 Tax=Porphyridium purpureum TaxID=35688 RepID=A0A5J4YK53_PORPP|nr:hypothetical protein FVE85_9545 [Porphyridium purpureum]|eukprot:POR7888..scf261_15
MAHYFWELQGQSFVVRYQAGAIMEAPDCPSRLVGGKDHNDTVNNMDQIRMGLRVFQNWKSYEKATIEQDSPTWRKDTDDFSYYGFSLVNDPHCLPWNTGAKPSEAMFRTLAFDLDLDILSGGKGHLASELNVEQASKNLFELIKAKSAHRRA